jgi:LysW-gamma-L-lysine carboxypeptidase
MKQVTKLILIIIMQMEKSVELLRNAVAIYSTSGKEKEVSEFLVKEMKSLGFNSHRDSAGNAVGIIGSGKKTILLLGHIDTVGGEIPVKIENNNLYGRGSVDAKGSFCAFIIAAAKSEINDKKIILVGAVEEECPTSKGARSILDKYKPDYIIIGEPSSSSAVTLGYKGRMLIDYKLEQPMSHSSSEGFGLSEKALAFYSSLKDHELIFNSDKKGSFEKLQLKIISINSGSDGFNESVSMRLSYRLPPNIELSHIDNYIIAIKGNAEIKVYGIEKPVKAPKNNSLVKAFLKAIRRNGNSPSFKLKTGTSDMNILAEAFPNVPILAYGPGDSSLDHTPNEHIDLDEYKKGIAVLKDVLERI